MKPYKDKKTPRPRPLTPPGPGGGWGGGTEMIRLRNYARLTVSGGTKPERGQAYKPDERPLRHPERAAFCTEACPHPDRDCERGTCREYREKFGRRKDT